MLSVVLVVVGLLLLVGGGELLVRGAVRLAERFGLSKTVIGLTVVAWGTSMPELVVSLGAALKGSPDLAIGNVVGSNIFNVTAVLGFSALIAPLTVHGNTIRMEWPVMLLTAVQLHMLSRDGSIDRLEGAFFALTLLVFVAYSLYLSRTATKSEEAEFASALATERAIPLWLASGFVLVGVGLLVFGADLMVEGATAIAGSFGVSEAVIGLTVVAAGTSLPELAASCVAAYRGHSDVAIANVVGSSIFNVTGILGITALVSPLPIGEVTLSRDNVWMMATTLLLFPLLRSGMRISRIEGGLLAGCFVIYWGVLFTAGA